jgi:peptidoglycan-associated lipoprotein
MNAKLLLLVAFIVSISLSGKAQNRFIASADQAFATMQYNIALTKYKKAYSKSRSKPDKERISFQMAECYRMINNTKRAEPAYKRLLKTEFAEKNPLIFLYCAQAMKSNEKYADAKELFNRYAELAPKDPRGKNGAESCDLAQQWIDNPSKYTITNQKALNSKEADFSPAYADKLFNTLIFTSTREAATGKALDDWTGQNFSDLFVAKLDPKGAWSTPVLLDEGPVNTTANEGNPAVNSKFNNLYFTRCGTEKGSAQGCQIYVSRRTGRTWGDPKKLELGGDSTSVIGNPTLSHDELTIFYSADFEGGFGGKDIWMASRKTPGDDFKKPVNLGSLVNTPGDEMFPFMRNDTMLYFASNGHPGLGGLDIFRTTFSNGAWTKPTNLMYPMNSSGDDFSIIFNPEGDQGFMSSNRKGGRGNDDIYAFINPPLLYTLQGVVKDDRTLQFIQGASVKLVGSNGSAVEAKTDPKGFYSFGKSQIRPNTSYELLVSKQGYFNKKAKETTVGLESSKDFTIDFKLEPIPEKPIVLPDILYDLAKWDLKPQFQDSLQGLIKTLDENETIVVELASHTDTRGTDESNDVLSQKRAESVVNYLIERGIDADRLVAKGYGERVPRILTKDITREGFTFKAGTQLTQAFIDSLKTTPEKEAAHALNRRTEFRVLSKDYVPKPSNKKIETQKVSIQVNPEDNIVTLSSGEGKNLTLPCIVNEFNLDITLDEQDRGLFFSVDQTLELLKNGAISKNDFSGDADKILANGSVQDKAVFVVAEIRLANKSIFDVEATVSQKIKVPVMMGESILKKFGAYTLDKDKKQLIFK